MVGQDRAGGHGEPGEFGIELSDRQCFARYGIAPIGHRQEHVQIDHLLVPQTSDLKDVESSLQVQSGRLADRAKRLVLLVELVQISQAQCYLVGGRQDLLIQIDSVPRRINSISRSRARSERSPSGTDMLTPTCQSAKLPKGTEMVSPVGVSPASPLGR